MKVSVIGTGYVGLVSGVCLASRGNHVTCVDVDSNKVASINNGIPPIHEEGLEDLLKQVIADGSFNASIDLESAVRNTDLTLLAVGTPFDGEHIDLSYIETASQQIGKALKSKSEFHTVVVKSTVVPGTTENVVGKILSEYSDREIGAQLGLGMNPEFLREGEAVTDFMNPDRIVIGAVDQTTSEAMHQMYAEFPDVDKLETSPRTAEMIKYTANSLLATLISFSNEIGNLCASISDVDIEEVMQGVWLDKRFSPLLNEQHDDLIRSGGNNKSRCIPGMTSYLRAGCGFGGSCFPKDVSALIAYGKQHDNTMQMLDAVMLINANQPKKLVDLTDNVLRRSIDDPVTDASTLKVALLGLAFKAGTDDVRDSAAIPVIEGLQQLGYRISAYDPIAMENARSALETAMSGNGSMDGVTMANGIVECIENADAIVVTTAWPEFQGLPKMVEKMDSQPYVIDGRRMFKPDDFKHYAGIGLQPSS